MRKKATSQTYALSLHDALPIYTATHLGYDLASLRQSPVVAASNGTVVFAENLGIYGDAVIIDRKSTCLNPSHPSISYAVFCLKKKKEADTPDPFLPP